MRVAILTYAPDDLPGNAELLELARANRDEYCSRWFYHHLYVTDRLTNWYYAIERLKHVADSFSSHKDSLNCCYDAIWVLNVSSTITNMRIPLDSFLHGGPDVYAYFAGADRNGLNASSVVFMKNEGIVSWLDDIVERALMANHPWHEQHIFQKLAPMVPWRFHLLRNPSINQYHHKLIGWPEGEAQDWQRGDFVLSLPGIPLEERVKYVRAAHGEIVR